MARWKLPPPPRRRCVSVNLCIILVTVKNKLTNLRYKLLQVLLNCLRCPAGVLLEKSIR